MMNIYREFKQKNPAIKELAKTSTPDTNSFAALALAEKAEQCAKQFIEGGKTEKGIYYFFKAMNWYGQIDHAKDKQMQSSIKEYSTFLGKILP
jgi:hypothetical protein